MKRPISITMPEHIVAGIDGRVGVGNRSKALGLIARWQLAETETERHRIQQAFDQMVDENKLPGAPTEPINLTPGGTGRQQWEQGVVFMVPADVQTT